MIFAAAVLCQPFVQHLGMELAKGQLALFLSSYRKDYVLFLIAEETNHASASNAANGLVSR